ncbi:MAG: MobA/MobL family protein [Bacteroidota bacterium]
MHANIHINAISRSKGRSAVGASAYRSGKAVTARSVVAAAAYRAGERLKDEQAEKTFDYTRKHHVEASSMLAPAHAKDWARDRETYWNAVEGFEKRKDALLAKEAVLVLPRNLSQEQRKQVVEGWANENLVEKRGLVVDYAIHAPDASDGDKNYHAHVLYYPRPIAENGEFDSYKLTGYKTANTVDGTKTLKQFRFSYQDHLNKASAENDNNQIVWDLRSYRERGINRKPQPKKGQKVTHLEKRGYRTEWNKEIEKVKSVNNAKSSYRKHVATYRQMGTNTHTKQGDGLVTSIRNDVANRYYDVMYGDGTENSFYHRNSNEHER